MHITEVPGRNLYVPWVVRKANFDWALTMFLILHEVLSRVISKEPWGEHYYLPNFTDEEM